MQTTSADPLLLGFVLMQLLTAEDELAEATDCMQQFAEGNGYSLGAIYLEESMRTLTAFTGLIEAVHERQGSAMVLVPSLLHFQAMDPSADVKGTFERTTGARVLVATSATTQI